MAILDILNRPMFSSRFKLPMHIVQAILATVAVGLSVPRLFAKNQPRTRASTIALGMGAKSLIFLAYMLVSEHVQSCKRWHSYKANVILHCLEIVFWAAVAFLVFQSNLDVCVGYTCILSWIVVGISVVMHISEQYSAAIAIRELREYKKMLVSSSGGDFDRVGDEEEMVARSPAQPKATHPHDTQYNPSYQGYQA
ncbi:hypothetical protein P153DRAFT_431972 [Dothidotthia symphoricarpi CBS 119687]|uniref:MARVEL domain-containing protein n=1 Tax=Dothidotthia symphoricarpi CBS 119687 TaxID=1392245 RepID=A0A6A6ABM2_9PLEO|nr:uncharacterized protein P153DRAFT_431972 [Dothidotthia symphoricarpi CBS 119687]KAF2128288.1 hypothetical protein P153DRAFT_431972 [Dothidotthia symphoricarpi CBS 119687]